MKTISLTQGMVAVVDDEDFDRINAHKWCAQKRKNQKDFVSVRRGPGGGTIFMHREITMCPHGLVVDHKNHDTLDNRKENLRICINADNLKNRRGAQKNSISKIRGVRFRANRFEARVGKIYIGRFETKEEAVTAHARVANSMYGEFAGVK